MIEQRYMILDFETRSRADLKKVGAVEYAKHKSTEILCAAWRVGTRQELPTAPIRTWVNKLNGVEYEFWDLISAFRDSIYYVAHNAMFEQAVTKYTLSRYFDFGGPLKSDPDQWVCTASLAAALAFPRALGDACRVLNLSHQKDKDGHRLMLKMCKPRKATKYDKSEWHETPDDLRRLTEYCAQDVEAETALFLKLPPLSPYERGIWCLDQTINFRGFAVDRELVKKCQAMIEIETKNLTREVDELSLSQIESTNQRDVVMRWLTMEGIDLPDLRSKTVDEALITATGDARRMLEIRKQLSKTSTAKFDAFEMRSRSDGRCRDNLIYHGASTGRWSGVGVQPQNFPRGTVNDTDQLAEILLTGDLELVRAIYGSPMQAMSSALRAVVIAPDGKKLVGADYAAIETRVLFWIAGHETGLQYYRDDADLYKIMASKIYNVPLTEVTKSQRQIGKGVVLGCGYSMGATKFKITCEAQGIEISDDVAKLAVAKYRSEHYPIPELWYKTERAAIEAVKNLGKSFKIGGCEWYVKSSILWCVLPSGRRLAFYAPELRPCVTPWGEEKSALWHYSVNPITKEWQCAPTYGGKLVENLVQATARDFMASAMPELERCGFEIVLTAHDEILAETYQGYDNAVEQFSAIMSTPPSWARDCPIKVEAWEGKRYRK